MEGLSTDELSAGVVVAAVAAEDRLSGLARLRETMEQGNNSATSRMPVGCVDLCVIAFDSSPPLCLLSVFVFLLCVCVCVCVNLFGQLL